MEVKIELEAGQIGDTVIDLFKSLSAEKKEELALTVLREWLISPEFLETENKKMLLLDEYKSGKYDRPYDKYSTMTDEQIMRNYDFTDKLKSYKNSKQIMVEDIKTEIISYYKKSIAEQLEKDEKVQALKEVMMEELAGQFPQIIINALTQTFANSLVSMKSNVDAALMCSSNAMSISNNIAERLNSKGI